MKQEKHNYVKTIPLTLFVRGGKGELFYGTFTQVGLAPAFVVLRRGKATLG